MSDLEAVVIPLLPLLRRHARALTGNQAEGDRQVRRCLERLVEDPAAFLASRQPRRELYRRFYEAMRGGAAHPFEATAPDTDVLTRRLAQLPVTHRELLLLTAVEEFSAADAGHILGLDERAAYAALDAARGELKRQSPTSVLIIEDEPVISLSLAEIVRSAGHRVTGIATTKAEAVELAVATPPGLVLADIQLQDGSSGIEAAQQILARIEVPVVFITAFPERLLTGQRPEPTFLVTKPFNPNTVLVTMSQALLTRHRE